MLNNRPVTQKEVIIPEEFILSTTTDLSGTVLTASDDFIRVSGYPRSEFIGQPHNILRHPDVPAAVFKDMWETLKKGKTWSAIVKNRAKSGDHYWVLANASPIVDNGKIVGYISVRTALAREQIQQAESLYRDIEQGRKVIQGGFVRSRASTRWDFLTVNGSLHKVLLVNASLILLIGILILSLGFYQLRIEPIEARQLAIDIKKSSNLIASVLEAKVVSVMDISASLSGYDKLGPVLVGEAGRDQAVARLSGVRDHFSNITSYQNIRAHLYGLDKRSIVKSWQENSFGEVISHPLLDQVITQPKVAGGLTLNFADFGVGVTGFSPVYYQNQFVGVLSASGGIASVVGDLKSIGFDWVLLIDERAFKGNIPLSIASNQTFKGTYRLAHDRWFNESIVKQLQQHFVGVDLQEGAQQQAYRVNDQIIVDIPAHDRHGNIIGRHVLIHSAAEVQHQIEEATAQAIQTIITFVVFVMLIVGFLIMLVQRRTIKPLTDIATSMKKMISTGRFNDRVFLLDTRDEISDIVNTFNGFAGNVQRALCNINDVMSSIADGQFDVEIKDAMHGDLRVTKNAVNGSVASVGDTMRALSVIMDALYQGDFNLKMPETVKGDFRDKVDQALHSLQLTINSINHVMAKMQEGDFNHRVEVEARGDLLTLKNGINNSMEAISDAISKISEVVGAQASGDLTVELPSGHFKGELHNLKNSINYSMEKMKEVVNAVSQASVTVSNAASEVSQGSIDLSQRVQEQAAALEQTSATMDQMNSVVQSNTQNAHQTAQVTKEVQAKANQGAAVMQQTIEAMNSIQQSSHKIADIVSLIDGIAFQTNLLALNAAVEAARAGDHGRGFAVVASEVRALAQKSAEAAKDIKGLINESVGRIDEGTKLASESGAVLKVINDSINGVATMINQIAQASSEQSEGIKQVHNAIAQIDGVTQQNAALVEQTSAASESLSEQAGILQKDMAFFKTGNATNNVLIPPKSLSNPVKGNQHNSINNSKEWTEF
ncbi:methyl-accepting chemotaxis protein [Thiomicrospira microaerophila]|uniref:methyl-accepting chemotaxis protein n=1 Tax=Thiomicrospira microaerophila TaxID=406020 RepID=UPI0018E09510|nr:methyl-accepting chemotaxis protein [Thiomicrospira microaerophila]